MANQVFVAIILDQGNTSLEYNGYIEQDVLRDLQYGHHSAPFILVEDAGWLDEDGRLVPLSAATKDARSGVPTSRGYTDRMLIPTSRIVRIVISDPDRIGV
jgi:hypothetical protein